MVFTNKLDTVDGKEVSLQMCLLKLFGSHIHLVLILLLQTTRPTSTSKTSLWTPRVRCST